MEIKPLIHGYLEDIPNPNYSSSFEFDSPWFFDLQSRYFPVSMIAWIMDLSHLTFGFPWLSYHIIWAINSTHPSISSWCLPIDFSFWITIFTHFLFLGPHGYSS
jgi:hypothetical protein